MTDKMNSLSEKYGAALDNLRWEINIQKAKAKPIQQEISRLELLREDTVEKLAIANTKPRVSDHAVIRYLERIHGFNFEDQRKELLSNEVIEAMKVGVKTIKRDGYSLVLKGNVVVTILD